MSAPDPGEGPLAALVELRTEARDSHQREVVEAEARLHENEQALQDRAQRRAELEQELARAAAAMQRPMTAAQARASEDYSFGLQIDLEEALTDELLQRDEVRFCQAALRQVRERLAAAEAELRAAQQQLDRLRAAGRAADAHRDELEVEDLTASRRNGRG